MCYHQFIQSVVTHVVNHRTTGIAGKTCSTSADEPVLEGLTSKLKQNVPTVNVYTRH